MNAGNVVTDVLIANADKLFVDFNFDEKVHELNAYNRRIPVSKTEKVQMQLHLTAHNEEWDKLFIMRCTAKLSKSKVEERIFVIGSNRMYLFSKGGKIEMDVHYLDLSILTSASGASLMVTWQGETDRRASEVTIRPICFAGFDVDIACYTIKQRTEEISIGKPEDSKFIFNVAPPDRCAHLLERIHIDHDSIKCNGFVDTYKTVCDYYNAPVHEDVTWDLQYLFHNNNVTDFNLNEFIHNNNKYPNPEFQTLVYSLHHNTWFKSFIAENQRLGNESVVLLAHMLKYNHTLTKLVLKNAGATRDSFTQLAASMESNKNLQLRKIYLSGNSIEDKGMQALANWIGDYPQPVKVLDLSNTVCARRGVTALLTALKKNKHLCDNLEELKLSGLKFDNECSRLLGLFLGKASALRVLDISNTGIDFRYLCSTLESNNSLSELFLNQNKITTRTAPDIVLFVKRMPKLLSLHLCNTGIPVEDIVKIIDTASLDKIDISDNDLGDQGVKTFCTHIKTKQPPVLLRNIVMNGVWGKQTRTRAETVTSLAEMLDAVPITRLSMQGNSKWQLRRDLLPLIFYLINNRSLKEVDIGGHQAEDHLALALEKVLQHNKTLETLYWDGNLTTFQGLTVFKIGLARNKTLKKMPLPLLDMAAIIKQETDSTPVITLANEIQAILFDNALHNNTKEKKEGGKKKKTSITRKSKQQKLPVSAETTSEEDKSVAKPAPTTEEKRTIHVDVARASAVFGKYDLQKALEEESIAAGGADAETFELKKLAKEIEI